MMKRVNILFFAITIFLLAASAANAGICDCCGCSDCVMTYYFHTNMRCKTCKLIEEYTKEAIEESFVKELEAHKICFQVINTEEKGNEHFNQDYQLYTKSVVLALVQNEKQVKYKNLTKIWELTGNKQRFQKYIVTEINDYLKEL